MRMLETDYCTIDFDSTRALLRFTRTDQPYRSIEDLEVETAEIGLTLDRLEGDFSLLVDLRAVPPRDDAAFEAAVVRLRRRMFARPARIAFVVRTAVGALQVKRHVREDGVVAEVFEDEALALAYLGAPTGEAVRPLTSRPPPRLASSLPPPRRPSSRPPHRR